MWKSLTMHHGFVDGNKRADFAATYVFLGINGIPIDASAKTTLKLIVGSLEAGNFQKDLLETWLRKHTTVST